MCEKFGGDGGSLQPRNGGSGNAGDGGGSEGSVSGADSAVVVFMERCGNQAKEPPLQEV